jgi:hypothetical protein
MHVDASLLLLDRDATRALLKPDEVLAAVREAFALHASCASGGTGFLTLEPDAP